MNTMARMIHSTQLWGAIGSPIRRRNTEYSSSSLALSHAFRLPSHVSDHEQDAAPARSSAMSTFLPIEVW